MQLQNLLVSLTDIWILHFTKSCYDFGLHSSDETWTLWHIFCMPANRAGYHDGDRVWLYRPTCTKGKSPKLQYPWKGPCKVITRINDVLYKIQRNPRSRMMMVHLDQLAPFQGVGWDDCPRGGSSANGWRDVITGGGTQATRIWNQAQPSKEGTMTYRHALTWWTAFRRDQCDGINQC